MTDRPSDGALVNCSDPTMLRRFDQGAVERRQALYGALAELIWTPDRMAAAAELVG